MWHANLLQIIKEKNLTIKQIAENGNISEKTLIRVIKNPDKSCYLDTLGKIAKGLNCTLEDILLDTKAVVGNESFATLQQQLQTVNAEKELLITENIILRDKEKSLNAEVDLLKLKLMHAEELLAVHNYYNKLKRD